MPKRQKELRNWAAVCLAICLVVQQPVAAMACNPADPSPFCKTLPDRLKRLARQQRLVDAAEFTGSLSAQSEVTADRICTVEGWAATPTKKGQFFSLTTSCAQGYITYRLVVGSDRRTMAGSIGKISDHRFQVFLDTRSLDVVTLDYTIKTEQPHLHPTRCCVSQGSITRRLR